MGFLGKKNKATPYREILKFHGKRISYAVERRDGEEINLGKNGGISVVEDEIVVMLDSHEVFRCKTKGAVVCTLMSANDCDIKGDDSRTDKRRHIVCFYAQSPH